MSHPLRILLGIERRIKTTMIIREMRDPTLEKNIGKTKKRIQKFIDNHYAAYQSEYPQKSHSEIASQLHKDFWEEKEQGGRK